MSALGRWLGSWAGRWYGAEGGEGPPPAHVIEARSVAAVVTVGRPSVTPVAPPEPEPPAVGGWSAPWKPAPRRVTAAPVFAEARVGSPRITLQLRAVHAGMQACSAGRPLVLADPVRPKRREAPKPTGPTLAELQAEDEQLLLMD
jgi:hypothetical protein